MSADDAFARKLAACMEGVARDIMGKPTSETKGVELRYGTRGSFAVDIKKGTWHDHQHQIGGGVIELVKHKLGYEKTEAIVWLQDNGFLEKPDQASGARDQKFAGFLDHHPVAIFDYQDEHGQLAYQVLKFPKEAQQKYMQRRPHPAGGWIWKLQGGKFGKVRSGDWFRWKEDKKYEAVAEFDETQWFLYRRSEVIKAVADGGIVLLPEGEKDVETLREWGFTATTNQGGAKNWKPELNADLHGADIVILPDNDASGKARISLRAAEFRGFAKRVRVLDLAKHWPGMPEKADVTDWKEQAGGTREKLAALIEKAPLWKPERPQSRFGAIPWGGRRQQRKRIEFLVDAWIPETGVTFIAGPSGSGKSFFALHLALSIARELDFFNRPTKRRGVVYQAGEGGLGLLDRMDAYAKHFEVPENEDVPFELLPVKIDIYSKESRDTENLIAEIKALELTMSCKVGVVVIDTYSKATVGADEINGKDTAAILANVERIRDECGVNVIVVHHMNADGKKLRGHTSLRDNVDTVIVIHHDKDTGHRQAVLEKQKDGEDGLRITFTLGSVPVRVNEATGADVTSCVVLSVTEKERLKAAQERAGYSPSVTERRILANYFTAIDRHGKFVAQESDGPRAAIGRNVVNWKDYLAVALEKMIEAEDKKKAADAIRKEFARARDGLARYGIFQMESPYMWWTGKPIRGFPRTFPKKDVTQADLSLSDGVQDYIDSMTGDYEVDL